MCHYNNDGDSEQTRNEAAFLIVCVCSCDPNIAKAESLKVNSALVSINLRYNSIATDGAQAFAEALKANACLQMLDVWGNIVGDEGATMLAGALRQNGGCKHVTWTCASWHVGCGMYRFGPFFERNHKTRTPETFFQRFYRSPH
jgi:hypothetical protein